MKNEIVERKKSFILYDAFYEQIKYLCMEDRGYLLTALYEHRLGLRKDEEIISNLPDMAKPQFEYIRTIMDIDCEKYIKQCAANSKNGALGGRGNTREKRQEQSE